MKAIKIACVLVFGAFCCMSDSSQSKTGALYDNAYKAETSASAFPERHSQVSQQLFLGTGKKQALIVGLGGSEGGNPWASNYWKVHRSLYRTRFCCASLGVFWYQR